MDRMERLNIMIIDDQTEVLDIYEDVLQRRLGHYVECVTMPGEAIRLLRSRLFDIVLVDAKITYKGAPLGGIILADEISSALGVGSVLLMSQYDVRETVSSFNSEFAFLAKPRGDTEFVRWVERDLLGKVTRLVGKQYGFVVMPFTDPRLNEWYSDCLVSWVGEAGFGAVRMDEFPATGSISVRMLEKIRNAHFVVVVVTGDNANVFYETGFAHALQKRVVFLTTDLSKMPFDVRSHFAIEFELCETSLVGAQIVSLIDGLRGGDSPSTAESAVRSKR